MILKTEMNKQIFKGQGMELNKSDPYRHVYQNAEQASDSYHFRLKVTIVYLAWELKLPC